MRRFTIGIDGYNLAMPRGTGIATYGFNLAHTMQAAGHRAVGVFGLHVGADPALRETLFYDHLGRPDTGRLLFGGHWRKRVALARATLHRQFVAEALEVPITHRVDKAAFCERVPAFDRLVSVAGLFPLAMRHFNATGRFLPLRLIDPPEIMHWTYPLPVRLEDARNVYTIHDLVPLRLPYTTLTDKPRFARLLRACVEPADHICTVSNFSRADIVDQCGIDPARITNTWQTSILPDAILADHREECAAQVRGLFGLADRGFFLFFGALEPKKNLGRLIEAYLGLGTDTPLVLVGARAWMNEGELALLPADDPRIVRLDYLGRNALLRLARTARALLFPSIFEGFGLPVLEAMSLGTPVLTSAVSSLPEVAGDAALLVNPYDTGAIAAGIARLDADAGLRARLAAAGLAQAARFSQGAYLARLEAMYAHVLGLEPRFTSR